MPGEGQFRDVSTPALFPDMGAALGLLGPWRPVFNVQHAPYNVVPGVNGTKGIKRAIRDAERYGRGIVYFPASPLAYIADPTLTWDNAAVALEGDGAGQSTLQCTSAALDFIIFGANAHGSRVKYMTLWGAAVDNTTDRTAITTPALAAPNDCEVDHVTFSGPSANTRFNNCVLVDGNRTNVLDGAGLAGMRWTVTYCVFDKPQGDDGANGPLQGRGYGVLLSRCVNCVMENNRMYGAQGRGRHLAYVAGTSWSTFKGNIAEGCDNCVILFADYNGPLGANGNTASGNIIRGGGGNNGVPLSISVAGIGCYGVANDNAIVDNTVIGWLGLAGIEANSAATANQPTRNYIANNSVYKCNGFGINVCGAVDTAVVGNKCYQNSQGNLSTYAGIKVQSDQQAGPATACTGTKVLGNTCWGSNQSAGVNVDSAAPVPTGVIIMDNIIPDYAVYPIQLGGGIAGAGGAAGLAVERNYTGRSDISGDNGDANVTVFPTISENAYQFNSALTANRTVTYDATNMYKGFRHRVSRKGLGAFTLDVGGVKTIPAGTAGFVDVEHDGTALRLMAYGAL